MRFAYILEVFPQNGETWIRYEIEELIARGHTVRVYSTCPRPRQHMASPESSLLPVVYIREIGFCRILSGLPRIPRVIPLVWQLLFKERISFRWMLRILRALYHAALVFADFAEFSPDLTLCHFAGNRALLGLLLSCMVGKPYVMVMHAADVWNRPPGLSVLVRNAKEVWTISDYNKRYLTEHYADINWNNLRVVRMGVDLVRLPFRMNRPADSRQILFVGRLVPMKGADILIRACAMLHQRGYAFQLFVIGDGPQHRYLQGLARDLGIGHIVHFLGSQPVDIVYDRLLQASVFALPCRIANDKEVMDGIPVALIEAMASGTPVISTPVSGVPELIQNGRNGLLVEPENVEELCDAICCLWQMDPEHLNYLIKQARETVEGLHDIRSTVDEIIRAAKTDSPEESQNILAVG